MEQQEKLNRFINAVKSETDRQTAQILSEANAEKEAILSAAVSSAREARERHISDSLKMEKSRCMRNVSKAELDIKREVLLCREKLTEELFSRITEKISEFRKTDNYLKLLISRLKSEKTGSNALVCLAPEDMPLADRLKASVGGELTFSEDENIKLGGFYIIRHDNNTVIDRTFDCSVKEQRSLFASKNVMLGREER